MSDFGLGLKWWSYNDLIELQGAIEEELDKRDEEAFREKHIMLNLVDFLNEYMKGQGEK